MTDLDQFTRGEPATTVPPTVLDARDACDARDADLEAIADRPGRRTSGVSAGLAMLGVALVGVLVSAMAERGAQAPDGGAGVDDEPLSTGQVMALCEEQLAEIGLEQFSIPDYVPSPDGGDNVQAPRPWQSGTTLKVMPFGPDDVKQRFVSATGREIAECTVP